MAGSSVSFSGMLGGRSLAIANLFNAGYMLPNGIRPPLLFVVLFKRTALCSLCIFLEALTVGRIEWKVYFCVEWHQRCEIMTYVRQGRGAYAIMKVYFGLEANRQLIGAKMKGCQVRDWIVGESDMRISRIVYITLNCRYDCLWGNQWWHLPC